MLMKKNVVTRVKAKQSKVPTVYCSRHSLRLVVKQLNSSYEADIMGTVDEICAFQQKEKTYWEQFPSE